MNHCYHSLTNHTIETIAISFLDSRDSFPYAHRSLSECGAQSVYLPKLARRHGLRGVTHCEATRHANGEINPRIDFVTSSLDHHVGANKIKYS